METPLQGNPLTVENKARRLIYSEEDSSMDGWMDVWMDGF